MRHYIPIFGLLGIISFLLFHIGGLNMRYTHVHEELNSCAEDRNEYFDMSLDLQGKLEECQTELDKNSEEVRKAIENSIAYCRG